MSRVCVFTQGIDHASAHEDLMMTHTNYTLHYALMTGLRPGAEYYYKLGCTNYVSACP